MSVQKILEDFHAKIKVEKDELREKRDILVGKIKASIANDGHPLPDVINQGSYIYGVGIKPLNGQEYDIDVGLIFPICSKDYSPTDVRSWVYDAIKGHTNSVEDRGPCIRVRYAAGYHVDLVVYAQFADDPEVENLQLARNNDVWVLSHPKELKQYILNAREKFLGTKDGSGADQIQRITRYLKRWNDFHLPSDTPGKPSGLALLLLVIQSLPSPVTGDDGQMSDLDALLSVTQQVAYCQDRVVAKKPTPPYDDVFEKLDDKAMLSFKQRCSSLLSSLEACKGVLDSDVVELLSSQFGSDIPEMPGDKAALIADMKSAIPSYKNPAKPWSPE